MNPPDSERGYHIPIANLETVEGKHTTGVDMSNDRAIIQGDVITQLDEIGFGHEYGMSSSAYRAVLSDFCA